MPRFKRFQNTFLGGEIDPEFLMRGDAESANQSCKRARNVALLQGGGAVRRPGSALLQKNSEKRRLWFFRNMAGTSYGLGFANGQARLLNATTGALITSAAAPWATANLDTLTPVNANGGVYVFSSAFEPRFVAYDGVTLTVSTLTYASGVEGIKQQPYYRFAKPGVTITPSGTTGPITLTASASLFVAGHANTYFRIAGREVFITSVTTATSATATVQQKLYPTWIIPVASVNGFRVGQIVEGSQTKYRGEVVIISGSNLHILMHNSFEPFFHDAATPANSEKVVGPTGESQMNGPAVADTNAAALLWDEQMISAARGYPSTGALHRNRLVMAGFPNAKHVIAASAIGQYDNFNARQFDDVDPEAADAFIEGVGFDDVTIKHLASLENLMVLTDRGVFYVPELETAFAPGEVSFLKLGPEGASGVMPVVVTEGLVYNDMSGGKIMAIIPTGLVGRPWEIRELSQAASHLIVTPLAILATSTAGARKHRMIFVLNSDGTVGVLSYQRFESFAGWALWSRAGATCNSVGVNDGAVWFSWNRDANHIVCSLDWSATLDEQVSYSASAPSHASTAITLSAAGHFNGLYTLDGAGLIAGVAPAAGLAVGFDFAVELDPFPPYDAERGRNPTSVNRVFAHIHQSGAFSMNGEYWSPYRPQDSLFDPPPLRTADVEFHLYEEYGDSFLTAPQIRQSECAPLHVQALTMEGRF